MIKTGTQVKVLILVCFHQKMRIDSFMNCRKTGHLKAVFLECLILGIGHKGRMYSISAKASCLAGREEPVNLSIPGLE